MPCVKRRNVNQGVLSKLAGYKRQSSLIVKGRGRHPTYTDSGNEAVGFFVFCLFEQGKLFGNFFVQLGQFSLQP